MPTQGSYLPSKELKDVEAGAGGGARYLISRRAGRTGAALPPRCHAGFSIGRRLEYDTEGLVYEGGSSMRRGG